LFLGLGILLIWLAVRNLTEEDKTNIVAAFKQTDYFWIAVSLVLSILSHVSRAVRWRILIQPLGFNPKISNTFFAVMVGYLANFALPRLGEVSRCGVLTKYEKIPFTEAFGTVIAERVIDLICLIIIFFATLIFQFDELWGLTNNKIIQPASVKIASLLQHNLFLPVFGIIMIGITASFFMFRKKNNGSLFKKINGLIQGFVEGLKSAKNIKRPFLFIFHTLLIWVLYISSIFTGFMCFGETAHLGTDAAFAVLIFSTLGVIFVPGGTGASQALVTETLTVIFKISFTFSFAFAWLMWTSQFALILLFGVISLILLPILNKSTSPNKI
jgi:glycosyltransferase 2 family protein